MAACFPTYRPLIRRAFRFISSSRLLTRFYDRDIGDIELTARDNGTTEGCGASIHLAAAKDRIFKDDGDMRRLVNCHRGEVGNESTEVGNETADELRWASV